MQPSTLLCCIKSNCRAREHTYTHYFANKHTHTAFVRFLAQNVDVMMLGWLLYYLINALSPPPPRVCVCVYWTQCDIVMQAAFAQIHCVLNYKQSVHCYWLAGWFGWLGCLCLSKESSTACAVFVHAAGWLALRLAGWMDSAKTHPALHDAELLFRKIGRDSINCNLHATNKKCRLFVGSAKWCALVLPWMLCWCCTARDWFGERVQMWLEFYGRHYFVIFARLADFYC